MLRECAVGAQPVTIGRLPQNAIVIDNPAVSTVHARVIREGDTFILEDLQSTNGTFVNEQKITRHMLREGDNVVIGKHHLTFSATGAAAAPTASEAQTSMAHHGGTVMLDTRQYRELLAKSGGAAAAPAPAAFAQPASTADMPTVVREAPRKPAPQPKVAVLRVLSGRAEQTEYTLTGQTSLIGKSDTALVRLKGWFKPKVAVAIGRKADAYTATPLGGKPRINGHRLESRHDLKTGDVIEVSGLTLEFELQS